MDSSQSTSSILIPSLLTDGVFLSLLVIWAVNDHYFKYTYPSFLTGKLSDVTSLACTPILMFVVMLAFRSLYKRFTPSSSMTRTLKNDVAFFYTLMSLNAILMGGLMVMINLSETWANLYRLGLGYAQWPWVGLWKWSRIGHWPPMPQVILTVDPSDAWTAPAAFISLIILRRSLLLLSEETMS